MRHMTTAIQNCSLIFRRHIPNMETFCLLCFPQQDIALVPDELLATWQLGDPMRTKAGSQLVRTTPTTPINLFLTTTGCPNVIGDIELGPRTICKPTCACTIVPSYKILWNAKLLLVQLGEAERDHYHCEITVGN